MKRTFLVVLLAGAWQKSQHSEQRARGSDGPCLEDVGGGERELW